METVGTALPKFDPLRREHVTAPVGRTRYFVRRKARFNLHPLRLQLCTVSHSLTLSRRPCCELAAHWPRSKIGFGFGGRQFAHFSGNADLSFQISPIEYQRRLGVFRQFLPFAAVVVREKNETSFINAFEQDDTCRWSARFVRSGQRHCRDICRLRAGGHKQRFIKSHKELSQPCTAAGCARLLEPSFELCDRVGMQMVAPQYGQLYSLRTSAIDITGD